MTYTPLFGLNISDTTLEKASASIIADAKQSIRRKIFFINAHCVNVAAVQASYLQVLQNDQARLYADGSGDESSGKIGGNSISR